MFEAVCEPEAPEAGNESAAETCYRSPCRGCKGNGACCGKRYEKVEPSTLTLSISHEQSASAPKGKGAGYAASVPWYMVDTEHVDPRHQERFAKEKAAKLAELEEARLKRIAQHEFREKISYILSLKWIR